MKSKVRGVFVGVFAALILPGAVSYASTAAPMPKPSAGANVSYAPISQAAAPKVISLTREGVTLDNGAVLNAGHKLVDENDPYTERYVYSDDFQTTLPYKVELTLGADVMALDTDGDHTEYISGPAGEDRGGGVIRYRKGTTIRTNAFTVWLVPAGVPYVTDITSDGVLTLSDGRTYTGNKVSEGEYAFNYDTAYGPVSVLPEYVTFVLGGDILNLDADADPTVSDEVFPAHGDIKGEYIDNGKGIRYQSGASVSLSSFTVRLKLSN